MVSLTKLSRIAVPVAVAAQVAGCANSDLSRTFGLVRDTPDEFTVVTRAPLSMPPDFTLRPPMPGAPRPQERSAQSQAEAALVPDSALGLGNRASMSAGQAALVRDAGGQAPADIRARVDQEAQLTSNDSRFIDKLLFWQPTKTNNAVVDPSAEAERLRRDAAVGAAPTSGDTPIIREEKKNWFSRLFSGG
jgi:hypothetical protein